MRLVEKHVSKEVFHQVFRLILVNLPQLIQHSRALPFCKLSSYEIVLHTRKSCKLSVMGFVNRCKFEPEFVHRYISHCINLGNRNSIDILFDLFVDFRYHAGSRGLMMHVLKNKTPTMLQRWSVFEIAGCAELVSQPAMLVRLLLHFNPTAKAILKMPVGFASILMQIDKESAFHLVSKRLEYYQHFSNEARDNSQFLIRVFREVAPDEFDHPFPLLKYASKAVRSDKQVLRAAVLNGTYVYQLHFADTSLKRDDAFFLEMAAAFTCLDTDAHRRFPFHAFHKTLYNRSKSRALQLVKLNGEYITSLSPKWSHLREVQVQALKTSGLRLLNPLPPCSDGQPELRTDQRFIRYMMDCRGDPDAPFLLHFTPAMWEDTPFVLDCIRICKYDDFFETLEEQATHLLERPEIVEALIQRSKNGGRFINQLKSSSYFTTLCRSNVELAVEMVEVAEASHAYWFHPVMPSREYALEFGKRGRDTHLFFLAFLGSYNQPFAFRGFLLQLLHEIQWKAAACAPRPTNRYLNTLDLYRKLDAIGLGHDVELCIQLARIEADGEFLLRLKGALPTCIEHDAAFLAAWVPRYALSSNKLPHCIHCPDTITMLRHVMLLPDLAHHAVSMASMDLVLTAKRYVENETDADLSCVMLGLLQRYGVKLLSRTMGRILYVESAASNPKVALTMMKTSPEFYFHLPANLQHDSHLLSWAFLTPRQHLCRRMREAVIYEFVRREQNERCIGLVHCWLAKHGLGFVQSDSAVAGVEINWIRSVTGKRKRGC